jgi:hypothetical protein
VSGRVDFACGRCGAIARADGGDGSLPPSVACPACGETVDLCRAAVDSGGGLRGCAVCAHPELYTQKDFPRAAGVAIVVAAAVLAPFTYYASLGAAAALDALLYWLAPNVVVCYACRARHRGFARDPSHPRFDREIDERLKYGERAVMGKPMRPGGTAGAPEPEH